MQEILVIHGGLDKLRAKAAAQLVANSSMERFSKIIFSGGKTRGADAPSEAENMKLIFLTRIKLLVPEIDIKQVEQKIMIEEASCDTEANASQVVSIPGVDRNHSKLTLLSSLSHLPRIQSIYSRIGFSNIESLSAELILYRTGKRGYKSYLIKYFTSSPAIKAAILEVPLYFLTQFERGRKWIRSKTQARIQ